MAAIIDRRPQSRHVSAENRKRFIDRQRYEIRQQIEDTILKTKLKNLNKKIKVKLKSSSTEEWAPSYDRSSGVHDYIVTGNDEHQVGDKIPKHSGQGEKQGAGEGEDGTIELILSAEEAMQIYFDQLELPDFIKKSFVSITEFIKFRAGYSKEGPPPRLDLRKTFEQALARKIATKGAMKEAGEEEKKVRFLDDIDLRYKFFDKKPKPMKQAVMFCVLDVSGSISDQMRNWAKKFYVLLYLFLRHNYEKIDVRFIWHTDEAKEVSEREFFQPTLTGGTTISSALFLIKRIIKEDYNPINWNIYIAQASDGDNWGDDDVICKRILEKGLLEKVQYYAYIHLKSSWTAYMSYFINMMRDLEKKYKKVGVAIIGEDSDILTSLFKLFGKDK